MGEKLRVCVVGCGEMGRAHATGWASAEAAEIVAVVDLDEGRSRDMAERHGVGACYRDYRAPVSAPEVDVVSVCVPAAVHTEAAVCALEHGKHVLCEKPVALSLRDADRIADAARAADRRVVIGFQRRFSEKTRILRELFDNQAIGRPVMWRVHMFAPIRTVRNKPAMHDLQYGNGGPFLDMACHTYDLWRLAFGSDPVRVTSRGFTFAEGKKDLEEVKKLAPDTGVAIIEFASGDLGVFSISWGLPPGVDTGGNEDILGPLGTIVMDGAKMTLCSESSRQEWECPESGEKTLEIAALIEQIEGRIPHPLPAGIDDGRIALECSLAVLDSIGTGESYPVGRGRSA